MKTVYQHHIILLLAFLFVSNFAFLNIEAKQTYTITDLGTLGGHSEAHSINNSGQIVGESQTADGSWHAFLWQNGNMIDLGTLGGRKSEAFSINNSGQIVGWSYTADGMQHVFLWQNGNMTNLDTPNVYLSPFSINDSGQMVGISSTTDSDGHSQWHICLWQNGKITNIGTFDYDSLWSFELINNSGQIVGYSYTRDANGYLQPHPFLWQNGNMTYLGTLGGNSSWVNSINDSGQIVGSSYTADGFQHAFLWQNGNMTDLSTLGGNYSEASSASSINNSGQIVGESGNSFLWQNGNMTNLEDLIFPGSGWSGYGPRDINNSGQIVGMMYLNHAFLLTPGRSILDPNPDLIDDQGNLINNVDLVAKLYDNPSSYQSKIRGTTVDGISKLLIVASSEDTMEFSIEGISADNIKNGTFSALGVNNSNSSSVTIQPQRTSDGRSFAVAVYTPPDSFDEDSNNSNINQKTIRLTLSHIKINGQTTSYSETLPIILKRPPVILIHGIWDNSIDCWMKTGFMNYLYSRGFDIYLANYGIITPDGRLGSAASFDPTGSDSYGRKSVENKIRLALKEYRLSGISATQVDIVAHSMGGLTSRSFIQTAPSYFALPTSMVKNFGKGWVHRLITIGTPHYGSELAKVLWDMKDKPIKMFGITIYSSVGELFKSQGKSVTDGAVEALRPGSDALRHIEATNVKSHAITGIWYTAAKETHDDWSWLIHFLSGKNKTLDEYFGTTDHDLIVNESSQLGGLVGDNKTRFTDTIHTVIHVPYTTIGRTDDLTETTNPKIQERVVFLLNTNETNKYFADSFPKPMIPANPAPERLVPASQNNITETDATIHIITPKNGTNFLHDPNTAIKINVEAINGASPQALFFMVQGIGMIKAPESPPYEVTFNVPSNAPLGSIEILALASDVTGVLLGDRININLSASSPPTELVVDPDDVLLTEQFPQEQLSVLGKFGSESLIDISEGVNGTRYSVIDNQGIVQVSENGLITALSKGNCTIEVKNSGLTAQVPVNVISVPTTIQKNINLSAGWNMISFPGILSNPSPEALIPQGSNIIPPFYTYDPTNFSYKEVNEVKLGEGYWALTVADESLSANITPISSLVLNLKAGWNMIGGVNGNVDFTNPQNNPDGSVILPIYTYNPTTFSYKEKTIIEPGVGYWVLALQDCTLKLDATTASPPKEAITKTNQVIKPDWILPIQMRTGDTTNEICLGIHKEASEGFDPKIDVAMPPKFDTGLQSVDLAFVINDRLVNRLSRDVRKMSDSVDWKVQAKVPSSGSEITWDISSLQDDKDMVLKVGSSEIDMRQQRSMKLPEGIHVIDITLKNMIPKKTTLLQNYPNPFNPETWIPYQLSESVSVVISIYDVSGRLVRKLDLGRKDAGVYVNKEKSAYWDGKNEVGEYVASGIYFYSIKAGKYTATGKMLILK